MPEYSAEDLERLTQWDTPTICNGLEMVVPERRATGFTIEPLVALDPGLRPVVGHARTVRIRARTPSGGSAEEDRAKRVAYYEYLASGPLPSIVVVEDLDDPPGFGAFWGEVHTAVHLGLGARGAVTNGSMRDLPDSAAGFQLLAGSVGPSHAHVHVVDFGGEVTVAGMAVSPGVILHADCHGAVVVPPEAVAGLPAAIDLNARREAKILTAARSPGFDIEKLRAALASAGVIH